MFRLRTSNRKFFRNKGIRVNRNLVSTKIRGKEIEFDGIRYSHTPSEIKVWAKFKGTDKEVLIALFERDYVTDKFGMTFPKNKKYSNYTLKDKFPPDYMNTYLRQKADDELDEYFGKYMPEIRKDSLELIRRKMTSSRVMSFRFKAMRIVYAVEFRNMRTAIHGLFYGTLKEMKEVEELIDRLETMEDDPDYDLTSVNNEEERQSKEEAYQAEYEMILEVLFNNYNGIDEIDYRDVNKKGEYILDDIKYKVINFPHYYDIWC